MDKLSDDLIIHIDRYNTSLNSSLVLYILAYGKNYLKYFVEKKDKEELLLFASKNGHLDLLKYLVSKGAVVTDNDNLAVASRYGQLNVVKYLVSQGADIKANYNCAVQWASENGQLNVVKYLVSQGADITADDNLAVRLASENGHLETVKYLQSANIRSRYCSLC